MKKLIILFAGLALLSACSGSKQLSNTEKSRAAQDRINASQSGATSVFGDID